MMDFTMLANQANRFVDNGVDKGIEKLKDGDKVSTCGKYNCLKNAAKKTACAGVVVVAAAVSILSAVVFLPLFAIATVKDFIAKTPAGFSDKTVTLQSKNSVTYVINYSSSHPDSWAKNVATLGLILPKATTKLAKYVLNK